MVFLLSGCVSEDVEKQPLPEQPPAKQPAEQQPFVEEPVEEKPLIGVSLSPRSPAGEDFVGFFEKAKETGNTVMWAGDWIELEGDGAAIVVTELSSKYDYTPLVEVTYYTQGKGELVRPLTSETRETYKNYAVAFAEKYHPRYLGFGIEINTMYEKSPDDFEEFVVLYNEIYDAVKERSPNTKIFTVFQLERMKGLRGGLFGGTNAPNETEWFLLDRFKLDVAAFTTYPGLIYKDPSEIPEDYYNEIKTHTSKPLAFTETGWFREGPPSSDGPTGWESDEEEQAEFIETFFERTDGLEPETIIWSFLYDQDVEEGYHPCDSMGLLEASETSSAPFEAWVGYAG